MFDQPITAVVNRRALSGEPETPLAEVVRRMVDGMQSAFVVCEDDVPIGLITERDVTVVLAHILEGADHSGTRASDVMTAPVHTLIESAPMGEVVRIMKERGFRRVPIVDDKNRLAGILNLTELQSATNAALEKRGRDLEEAVLARTAELQAANARLEDLTRPDGLTGLLNRRAMAERIDELHAIARRHGNPYAVIMLDIDHFKLYNDTQGHPAGDSVRQRHPARRQLLPQRDPHLRLRLSLWRRGIPGPAARDGRPGRSPRDRSDPVRSRGPRDRAPGVAYESKYHGVPGLYRRRHP